MPFQEATPGAAPETNREDVAVSIERSMQFLEREGQVWKQDRSCTACHHLPLLAWCYRNAEQRGLEIDTTAREAWDRWCQSDSLSHRNAYRLQKYDLDRADSALLPTDIKNKLTPIVDTSFVGHAEFIERFQPLLSAEEHAGYADAVNQIAELPRNHPDRCGGGLEVLAVLLLNPGRTDRQESQDAFRHATLERILELQRDDGSWMPGGQFLSLRRWSQTIAEQTTTTWVVLALSEANETSPTLAASLQRATAYLNAQTQHPEHREWLAMRLLYESQLGTQETLKSRVEQAIAAQQSDGGWAWEAGAESDPYSTGFMLYALARSRQATALTIGEGKRYLVENQSSDGSWSAPSHLFSKSAPHEELDAIYHYWGTAWATLGLIETAGGNEP